jgi:hypothetical protein
MCNLYGSYVALTDTNTESGIRVTYVYPQRSRNPKKACIVSPEGALLEIPRAQGHSFLGMLGDLVLIQVDRGDYDEITFFNFPQKKKMFGEPFVSQLPFSIEKKVFTFFQQASNIEGLACPPPESPAQEFQLDLKTFVKIPGKNKKCFTKELPQELKLDAPIQSVPRETTKPEDQLITQPSPEPVPVANPYPPIYQGPSVQPETELKDAEKFLHD